MSQPCLNVALSLCLAVCVRVDIDYFIWSVQLFYSIPLFGFAYTSHTQVYQLYHELCHPPSSDSKSTHTHASSVARPSRSRAAGHGYQTQQDEQAADREEDPSEPSYSRSYPEGEGSEDENEGEDREVSTSYTHKISSFRPEDWRKLKEERTRKSNQKETGDLGQAVDNIELMMNVVGIT